MRTYSLPQTTFQCLNDIVVEVTEDSEDRMHGPELAFPDSNLLGSKSAAIEGSVERRGL